MKVTDRIKTIEGIDSAYWSGDRRELTIYHHSDRIVMQIKVAHLLRQDDVIDSIDKITLIS